MRLATLVNKARRPFDPSAHPPGKRRLAYALNIAALALWCAFIGIAALYFGRVNYDIELFYSYFRNPYIVALNLAPVFIIAAAAFLLVGHVWAAFLVSALAGLAPALVNYFKVLLRGEPLFISDLGLISEAASFGSRYEIHFFAAIYLVLGAAVLGIVLAAVFLRMRTSLVGRLCSIGAAALGAVLFFTVYADRDIFYEKTFNMDAELPSKSLSEWSMPDQFASRGILYPFLFSATFADSGPPEGYSRSEAQVKLESYGGGGIPEDKKINIIAVMLEAFSDLTVFEQISFTQDPIPFWHELQGESISGNLITNVFAGGTVNTERTFLTGNSMLYDVVKNTGSFVRLFNDEGYRTEFCHPGISWVYGRQSKSDYFGFDSWYFQENRYDYFGDGTMIRDEAFLPDLLTLLDDAVRAGEPYFNFSLTYQNHSPYAESVIYVDEHFVERGELSDGAYNILTNYLWGLSITDAALRDFISELQNRDEPVAVVFFGDHKPWLGDDAYVYEELGICFDGDEGLSDKFITPYIIWGNNAAREVLGRDFEGTAGDFSPTFLMPALFDALGWEGDAYMSALRELRSYVDVIHSSGLMRENGVLTRDLSDEASEILSRFLTMEYYRRMDISYK